MNQYKHLNISEREMLFFFNAKRFSIIIDDGSTKDNATIIADKYEKKYPTICRLIHQENGCHGAGVNMGIKLVRGKYFKIVDSDDWGDKEA